MAGVMVFKGIKLGFRPGDIVISTGSDGEPVMSGTACTSYSTIPVWLKIAHDQRNVAKTAKAEIDRRWHAEIEKRGDLLFAEMMPALQSIVASATALDGIYSLLKPHSSITPEMIMSWRNARTARSAQVFEVIHQLYRFPNALARDTKQMVEDIYDLRGRAVHPAHELEPAMVRPDIQEGLDWRFCAYRFESCDLCYKNMLRMISHIHHKRSRVEGANLEVDRLVEALMELELVTIR
jgi:hypothetical protein